MNKFNIGDQVFAKRGLYKNVLTTINRFEYDENQYIYYLDGFPQQLANTPELNLEFYKHEFDDNIEVMFELFPFNEFKNNRLFLALDHIELNGMYNEREFHRKEPHIHFYHLKDDVRKLQRVGSDIQFEYGGALSLTKPEYFHHDNHTEILTAEEINLVNSWMKENFDLLNDQLEIVFDGSFQLKDPIVYNYKMLRVYL